MSTLKVNAIRHNGASSDAITLASDASNISIGSSVFHGIKSTLITNGDFSNGTANWTATTSTLSETSGVLTLTPDSGVNGFATQAVTNLVVGKHYNVQVTVTEDAGALSRLYVGTSANGNQNVTNLYLGVGTHSFSFKATATTHYVSLVVGGGTGQATKFDNVRLIESNSITFSTPTGDAPSLRPHAFEGMSINTGGVDRLIVSKEGNVTKPGNAAFHVTGTAAGVSVSANTSVKLPYNTETGSSGYFDVGAHYDTSNYRFTAPVAGIYFFYASMLNFPSANSSYFTLKGAKNGSSSYSYGFARLNSANEQTDKNFSTIVSLQANDTFEVQYEAANGGNYNYYISGGHGHFFGFLLQ